MEIYGRLDFVVSEQRKGHRRWFHIFTRKNLKHKTYSFCFIKTVKHLFEMFIGDFAAGRPVNHNDTRSTNGGQVGIFDVYRIQV